MNTRCFKTLARCVAAAFLAAAVIPLSVTAQEVPQADRPARTRIERPRQLADIGLTAEQEKALAEFRKARLDESRAFREEMAKIRGEMRELFEDAEANRAKIEALIDKRAGLMAGREKAALRQRAEWDKLFTPEQREKLRWLRRRAAGRAGRGRGIMAPGGRGLGWAPGIRPDLRRMSRLRGLNPRPLIRRWRW
jgi:Spy/CpxP family protein refolding chaperone